jgi:hypothetical protein
MKRLNKLQTYTLLILAKGKFQKDKLPYLLYLVCKAQGTTARKSSVVRRFMDMEFPRIMREDAKRVK